VKAGAMLADIRDDLGHSDVKITSLFTYMPIQSMRRRDASGISSQNGIFFGIFCLIFRNSIIMIRIMNSLPPVQMELFSEDDADATLKPYYSGLRSALLGAWKDWEEIEPAMRVRLSSRARACMVYDFILFRARQYFAYFKEVEILERRGLFLFGVNGKVLFRFKKLNQKRKHSNIPTHQQIELSLQRELPGMPPKAVTLIVGYQLDLTQTNIAAMLITYPNGRQIAWAYELPDEGVNNIVTLPSVANNDSGSGQRNQQKPKVKAKNITKKKDSEQT
jgi:hypothetical protein